MSEHERRPHNNNLIAVRDARERAVELISRRYSEDLIGADELDRRLERVERATTLDEIAVVTDDLLEPGTSLMPVVGEAPQTTALAQPGGGALVRVHDGQVPEQRQLVAVFGEQRQGGDWIAPRELDSFTIFGSTELDFRDAHLAPGETVIDVKVVFGSLTIIVPPGLAVESSVMAMFGGVERDATIPERAAGEHEPRLRVRGMVVFGAVEIFERLPGESRREARKRRRKERKLRLAEARESRQRMLKP
ncbi:MAG: DUF1707 and DUF2154 domain-containing protein [Myxococcales bacterium]|nr:DUF1707 and DUF2154 domain-containing protein [Myxococcales bacterium]MCB9755434.1 DUF1707 and DUF2154 domain-containing protein [Myxococcales bacterium]